MNRQERAKQIVEGTLAFFMMEFDSVARAIKKVPVDIWQKAIDERIEEVETSLDRYVQSVARGANDE